MVLLGANGEVTQAEVISGNPLLREAALHDVKSWRFSTADMNESTKYETEFVYRLDVQQKNGEPKLTVSVVDFRRVEVTTELYVHISNSCWYIAISPVIRLLVVWADTNNYRIYPVC